MDNIHNPNWTHVDITPNQSKKIFNKKRKEMLKMPLMPYKHNKKPPNINEYNSVQS